MADLQQKLESYLSNRLQGKVEVNHIQLLSGGACQENHLIKLNIAGGSNAGGYDLVMRTDRGGSLLSSLPRMNEYKVAEAAYNASVKTPKVMWLEESPKVIGAPFYFMQRIEGNATGRFIVKDKSINEARKRLADELAQSLAKLHSITQSQKFEQLDFLPKQDKHTLSLQAISEIREELSGFDEPHPAIELSLNWLAENAPVADEIVLIHGDFRTGNFMVSPEGLQGIVDWEFAHWGDRHEDIAWLCMRDWRFGVLKKEAGGFASRQDFYSAYERYSGIKVDERRLLFWEVMGNVRWAVGSMQQAERHISGKDRGIELASIGRRTAEMEFEMMRLIENAR
ncbi:MAG: phosphotransferase family protein [Leptonema sp. (in: Bacteria)]|nr:phosphotransferase family protein [Leptonema sp. (in: bacteria)]